MRRRWPLLLLLASALAFLASLYLPWQDLTRADFAPEDRSGELLRFLDRSYAIVGWTSDIGSAAAVFALVLAASACVALARPAQAFVLPLGRCGLLAAYGAFAVAVETRYEARFFFVTAELGRFHFAYGAYLGLAAGAGALVGALALRGDELGTYARPHALLVCVLSLGLLAAFALPWFGSTEIDVSSPGYFSQALAVACVAAIWLPASWLAGGAYVVLAGVVLLFTGGAVSYFGLADESETQLRYGAWVALGLALALLLTVAAEVRRVPRVPLRLVSAATCAATVFFVAALFFPWQGPLNGWALLGSASAALAISLAVRMLVPIRVSALELSVPLALFLASLGFASAGAPNGILYGAKLGFAAAALLLALTLVSTSRVDAARLLARGVPIVAVIVYLAVVLVPVWRVLPDRVSADLVVGGFTWLAICGVVLAVRLAGAWARPRVEDDLIVALPLALLALTALDLIRVRDDGMNWGRGIAVAACLLLVLFGWLEQRGRLPDTRLPQILRVDRL